MPLNILVYEIWHSSYGCFILSFSVIKLLKLFTLKSVLNISVHFCECIADSRVHSHLYYCIINGIKTYYDVY